jgi:hypothetical protein
VYMYSLSENLVFDLQCLVLVNMAGLTLPASQLHELIYPCVTDYIDSLCLVWCRTIRLFFRVDALERKKLNSL